MAILAGEAFDDLIRTDPSRVTGPCMPVYNNLNHLPALCCVKWK